jgi:tetratricopeptide (TPR) repeat protein
MVTYKWGIYFVKEESNSSKIETIRQTPGRINSPTTWNAISLGPFYEISDNLTLARSHYEEDLKTEEAEHGQWHPNVGITLNNLGRALKAQGNNKDAYLYFQRALEIAEGSFGPIHPEVALRAFILGDLLSDLGGYGEAWSQYQRAQQIMESLSGPDHLDVAIILNSLGNTAIAQGEPTEARAFFARALEIFRHNLGQDHPYTTITEEHLDKLPQTQLLQETVDDDYDFYF